MQVDPFTKAQPSYRRAVSTGHKTGQAWEGYTPSGIPWGSILGRLLVLASLALFVYAGWMVWSGH